MRQLTEQETKTLFEKLANYTGRSLNNLITTSDDPNDRYVFRLHGNRVYYMKLSLANLSTAIPRANLLSLGTCIGKFTKSGQFRLHITALDVIAPHARYKVWIKQNGEMPFLYGGNVVKAHVNRWSDDCPEHAGVVVFNSNDTPLGFGVTARSSAEARKLEPTAITVFRQGDIGEYLREVCYMWKSLRTSQPTDFCIGRYSLYDVKENRCMRGIVHGIWMLDTWGFSQEFWSHLSVSIEKFLPLFFSILYP